MLNKEQRPRSPNKVQDPYTLPDMYKDYIVNLDEDSPYYVTYKEYVGIVSHYFKAQMDDVLEKGRRFKLPFRMGDVCVTKKRIKSFDKDHLPIDWGTSRKLGKVIYHMNDHSDNFKYQFRWSKKMSRVTPNIGQYRLVFTRANKRRLAACIKTGGHDYITQE
jgi:hypothetical protein